MNKNKIPISIMQTESADERRRKLLNILLAIILSATIAALVFTLYLDMEEPDTDPAIRSLYSAGVMLSAGIAITYGIGRYLSSLLASLILIVFFTLSIVMNPGGELLYPNIYLFLVIPILSSSFLIYPWAGFPAAGIVSLWIVWASNVMGLPLNIPAIISYLILAAISWLSSRNLGNALNKLRRPSENWMSILRNSGRQKHLCAPQPATRPAQPRGQAFNSTLQLDQVLANVLGEVRQSFNAVAWSIWLVDQETQELVCYLVDGPRKELVQNTRLKIGEGVAGWTALHKETVLIPRC